MSVLVLLAYVVPRTVLRGLGGDLRLTYGYVRPPHRRHRLKEPGSVTC